MLLSAWKHRAHLALGAPLALGVPHLSVGQHRSHYVLGALLALVVVHLSAGKHRAHRMLGVLLALDVPHPSVGGYCASHPSALGEAPPKKTSIPHLRLAPSARRRQRVELCVLVEADDDWRMRVLRRRVIAHVLPHLRLADAASADHAVGERHERALVRRGLPDQLEAERRARDAERGAVERRADELRDVQLQLIRQLEELEGGERRHELSSAATAVRRVGQRERTKVDPHFHAVGGERGDLEDRCRSLHQPHTAIHHHRLLPRRLPLARHRHRRDGAAIARSVRPNAQP